MSPDSAYSIPAVDNPVFFLDYDGTLAPIVKDPGAAFPHPDAPGLLARLSTVYPVWIVTGRDLETLGALLPMDIPAVGLHGIAWGVSGETREERITPEDRATIRAMRSRLPLSADMHVEDKGALFAVHYRNATDPAAIEGTLRDWASTAPDTLVAIFGKRVVELRPKGRSKGEVVIELQNRHPQCAPIYIGDDTTDEDAFAALDEAGLSIKVGPGTTTARYRVPDVSAVMQFLRSFV